MVLGQALRLAYVLSAGTPALLQETSLAQSAGRLRLTVDEGGATFAGDGVTRRLDRLALAMGLQSDIDGPALAGLTGK
jgi:exopolyphosphatase/guanosine-5'-triphosphate,3'-diphosphate pyrophosphatase